MVGYSIVLLVAIASTYLLCFPVRKYAMRFGVVAQPNERRTHVLPIPTSGGAAMFVAFLLAMATAWAIPQFNSVFNGSSMPLGVVIAATIIFLVGLVDDMREVSPPAKVAGQVLSGAVMAIFGVTMLYFRVPLYGTVVLSADLAPLATVIWLVVIANAINLIDGLDGLAAGIVGIASASFFLYGARRFDEGLLQGPANLGPLIAIILVGICIGFLPHNFHPARIFMGDAGAMLLGLLLTSSTLVVSGQSDDQFSGQTFFFFAPILIPFFILGVPVVDTLLAIVRRARRRSGLATPDKEHLHHRLMQLGHGHRRAVLTLWAWTAALSTIVLLPNYVQGGKNLISISVVIAAVVLYSLFKPGIRRSRSNGSDAGTDVKTNSGALNDLRESEIQSGPQK